MSGVDLNKITVVVGLSGGVDSSVAALLLKRAGLDVRGVFMKCYWTYEGCQSDQDRASAARVASQLNIPFEVWDFEKEYRQTVVEYFYQEYQKGRTPNPDVVCNREIKFGLFLKKALSLGSGTSHDSLKESSLSPDTDGSPSTLAVKHTLTSNNIFIATGHYARIGAEARDKRLEVSDEDKEIIFPKFSQVEEVSDGEGISYLNIGEYIGRVRDIQRLRHEDTGIDGKFSLFGGVDLRKDQSYFLYDIDPEAIEHILFPLGNLTKTQVRQMARQANLPTADRPDSNGICFIGEVNISKFLKERIREHEGNVVDRSGNILGKHRGVEFYTIGQRHGFTIDQKSKIKNQNDKSKLKNDNSRPPYYVIGKNVKKNELVVGMGEECKTASFTISKIRNQRAKILEGSKELFVRIRNLGEFIPCELAVRSQKLEVTLAYPVFGVAPGQSAVFYRPLTAHSYQLPASRNEAGSREPEVGGYLWQVVGGGVIGD